MIRLLFICLIIGLGLSACKKEQNNPDTFDETHLKIKGELYSLNFLRGEMAKNIGVGPDSLIYHREDTTFTVIDYPDSKFSIMKLFRYKDKL